ncbi:MULTISPECIES: hypothetical protein [Methanoculleus]|jgi:hypothetical protein|uniref:hypothetical protein n=1 Tax=Methanoculleus TaxID=45989 RepID=UPI000ACC3864|nr:MULTISPECIES: hypothetical protein [Methanoculleus]NLN09798.1 hypothetical protein [Methanoculleus thermophilus]HQD25594.1 hypothetical protein [Methanoculleus thermophilus]
MGLLEDIPKKEVAKGLWGMEGSVPKRFSDSISLGREKDPMGWPCDISAVYGKLADLTVPD